MTASTIQNVVDYARVRLGESAERRWLDTQLVTYVSEAERALAGFLNRIKKSNRFRVVKESITLSANAESFDLTTLAKAFDWLITVSVVIANVERLLVNFEDEDAPYLRNLNLGGGCPISRINLQDDNLIVEPKFGSARTLYVAYAWIPAKKTSLSDSIETPQKYDDVLVEYVVWKAQADNQQANVKFEEQFAVRLSEIADLERSRRGTSNERVVQRARNFARVR